MAANPVRVWERSGKVAGSGTLFGGDFRKLVGALGSRHFYDELGLFFNEICGAEHFHVFLFEGPKPKIISVWSADGSETAKGQATHYMVRDLWREDKWLDESARVESPRPTLLHQDMTQLSSREMRSFYSQQHLPERLLLCGREHFGPIGMSMFRMGSDPKFEDRALEHLSLASDIVFPLISKHVDLCSQSQLVLEALTSLPVIEQVLSQAPQPLPPREAQVCARFLYGLAASAIAGDLNISQETVLSYRKRLYQRLKISSHRELLLWYLSLHADMSDDIMKPDVFSLKAVC